MLAYVLAAASAASFSVGWLLPGTNTCALFGWLGIVLLIAGLRFTSMSYKAMLLHGCICNSVGFYWLYHTIRDFGGLPPLLAFPIFVFFVVVSANQQLLFLWFHRHLPERLHQLSIAAAFAWVAAEFASVRIFPWSVGHMQLAFTEYAQFADVLGVPGITLLSFWFADALLQSIRLRSISRARGLAFVCVVAVLFYGNAQIEKHLEPAPYYFPVALVQGNVSIAEKHDIKYFTLNRERYHQLSQQHARPGSLVVWPESVLNEFLPDNIQSVLDDNRLPFVTPPVSLLIGGLTYRSKSELYNSAIAIMPNGTIPQPYHKQILMPFGEFTPFSEVLPWLKDLNQTAGNFTAGDTQSVFVFPLGAEGRPVHVAPLICYEDIVPSMALKAVRGGAHVLVNMTNDAWFGDTVAPAQHHLIAAWRAIENRRYLLRSTNAGLTAVVNPLGETTTTLPTFSEGVLVEYIAPINSVSAYTAYFGAVFELTIFGFVLASISGYWLRRRFASRYH